MPSLVAWRTSKAFQILHYELAMQVGPFLHLFHRRRQIRAPQKANRIFICNFCLLDGLRWAASLLAESQSFGPFARDAVPCHATCLPFNDLQGLADVELELSMIVAIRDLSLLAESTFSLLSLL